MFDVYNLFNANTNLFGLPVFGAAFLRPIFIAGGRLFKFGAQVDF